MIARLAGMAGVWHGPVVTSGSDRPIDQHHPGPPTASAALAEASARLQPVSATPRLDAELLMAHALGLDRAVLLLKLPALTAPGGFDALIVRRLQGEPVAQITGWRDFWDMRLRVTSDTLIPRPDSETLIAALASIDLPDHPRLLDLGTGTGALLFAALREYPDASGTGIDACPSALAVARRNADDLLLSPRVQFLECDWRQPGWAGRLPGRFDLVLANPPYIAEGDPDIDPGVAAHEPALALFAGADGLDAYRAILPALASLLRPGGHAVLEIGWQQAAAVSELARTHGFDARLLRDLGGRDRALHLRETA